MKKSLQNLLQKFGWTLGAYILYGISELVIAAPRVVTNPTGKSIDGVGDDALDWFFTDIRPWLIVVAVIAGVIGGLWGGRHRLTIAGFALAGIIGLMALPSIIARVWSFMS